MVEAVNYSRQHLGFINPGFSDLLAPDRRVVSSRDVMEKFGFDFREKAHRKLTEHGINIDRQELEFFEAAKPHMGSQALYFLEQKVGNHRIYVSYIPEKATSTEHMHDSKHNPPVIEIYDPLGGVLGLLVDGKRHEVSETGGPFVVNPGHYHQVSQSEGNESIYVIVLKDSAGIPDEEVHIAKPSG